ncbi:MAG: PPC domain-containing protein, partial [Planctomycetaceae bacterium]|nr:PPC domain-containing protein [Planctomycetaceae bacterium]
GVGDAEIFSSTGSTTNLIDPPAVTDDHGNDTGSATFWDRTGAVSGEFEAALSDSEDYFAVELETGRQYTFQADDGDEQSDNLTIIYVLDSSGDILAEGDWLADTWSTQVTVSTSYTGTYYIQAFNASSTFGSYSITQIADVAVTGDDHGNGLSSSDATEWDRTSPIAGNIEVTEDQDWFAVDLSQSKEYTFRTNAGTLLDTILSVYDSSFSLLDDNDDANNGENGELYSELVFTPPASGRYYLVVEGYGNSEPLFEETFRVGSYTLEQVSQTNLVPDRPVLTGANPTTTTNLRPTITWDSALNAAEYDVFISNTLTPQTPVFRMRTSETSLTPNIDLGIGRFRVWVQGISDANVRGPWSIPQGLRINTAASISNTPEQYYASSSMPTFTWDELPGALNYEIWVNNQTSGTPEVIHTTTGTNSFTPGSNLEVGVYRYWVRGISSDGFYGGWSSFAQIYVGPAAVSPIYPTFEVAPTFEWTSVAGVSSYDFWLQRNSSVIANPTELSGTTWSPVSDLGPGTYHWWVRPNLTAGGKGPWSNRQTFNVGGIPQIDTPIPLQNLTTVTWTPVTGAASYDFYFRSDVNGETLISQFNTAATSALFTTSDIGIYTFWVRAKDGNGVNSGWSHAASLTVPNLIPVINTPIQVNSQTTISWAPVAGVAEYEFRVRRQFEGGTFDDEWRTTETSVVIPTTLPGAYRVWVRSITSEGFVTAYSTHESFDVAAVSKTVELEELLVSLSPNLREQSRLIREEAKELASLNSPEPTDAADRPDPESGTTTGNPLARLQADQAEPDEVIQDCFAASIHQLLEMLD